MGEMETEIPRLSYYFDQNAAMVFFYIPRFLRPVKNVKIVDGLFVPA